MFTNRLTVLALLIPCLLTACGLNYKSSKPTTTHSKGVETHAVTNRADFHGEDRRFAGSAIAKARSTFFFGFDKSEISAEDQADVHRHAEYLIKHPNARLRIDGHTDERGSREYNIALGERRAKAVAEMLYLDGVPKEQVAIVSYGQERPLERGHDESSWSRNRRAELVYEVVS